MSFLQVKSPQKKKSVYWLVRKKNSRYCRIALVGVIHSTLWRVSDRYQLISSPVWLRWRFWRFGSRSYKKKGFGSRQVPYMHAITPLGPTASFLLPPHRREKKKLPHHYLFINPPPAPHTVYTFCRTSYALPTSYPLTILGNRIYCILHGRVTLAS